MGHHQSSLGSSLSRSSGRRSLACDSEVLARPAAPVAAAAFAHTENCPLLSYHPAPSFPAPEKGHQQLFSGAKPRNRVRVESDLMDLLLAASAAPRLGPRVGRSWTGMQSLALVPNTRTDKAPSLPSSVFAAKQEASVLGFYSPVKLRLRARMGEGQGPSGPAAHGTEAGLPPGQRALTVLKVVDVV